MTLRRENDRSFGDNHADLHQELQRYSSLNRYEIHHFADVRCSCGSSELQLAMDELQGVAVRHCLDCRLEHAIGDSDQFMEEAEPELCQCVCRNDRLQLTVGVSLYEDSEDVRWLYVGCRCPVCNLMGCYGDWKNEFIGYQKLLANV